MSKRILSGGLAALMLAGVCFSAEGSGSGGGDDRNAKIKDALSRLDTSENADWTQGGLPSVDRMKELTGLEDLKREEIGTAVPGFNRENAKSAPSDLSNAGTSDAAKAAGPTDDGQGIQGGDPENDGDRLEGEAASLARGRKATLDDVAEIAKHVDNPIILLEAAVAAMNASERYRKNGELNTFLRSYSIQQTNIKAHQARLDARWDAAEKAAAEKSAS